MDKAAERTRATLALTCLVAAALLGLTACTGSDDASSGEPATEPSDSNTGSGSDTDSDTDSETGSESGDATDADGDTSTSTTEPALILPDTPIGHYAMAVVDGSGPGDAAVGGSPAAHYLDYLARITELTAEPRGTVEHIDDSSFLVVLGIEYDDRTFDAFEITELGISDFSLNDRPISQTVAAISRPAVDSSGLGVSVVGGFSYITAGLHRIVILTVANDSDAPISVDPALSSFVEVNDFRQEAWVEDVGQPVEIGPGETADVVNVFGRGDADPNGLVAQVVRFAGDAGQPAEQATVVVPMGNSLPTFFTFDPDGTLRGQLDADLAFATGSAEASDQAYEILFKAIQEIRFYDTSSDLCVAGHADSVGDEASNLSLSQARAETVAAILSGYGVTNPIEATGYGEAFAPGQELDDPGSRRVDISFAPCPAAPTG